MTHPAKKIAVVMGSQSDWATLSHCATTLQTLGIDYHAQIISAHRTPDLLFQFAETAQAQGFQVIIAAAGGAAHLPGMLAAKTLVPIIGVPIQSKALRGMDSLLSIVQMPAGIPVATVAIGKAGAINAALLAAQILATTDTQINKKLIAYREQQTAAVLAHLYPDQ